MKFLTINHNNASQPELRTKTGYGGNLTNVETISKQKNVLITGAHHSGKSRMINRLYEDAEAIWLNQIKPYKFTHAKTAHDKPILKQGETLDGWQFPEPILLNGMTPLGKWTDHEGVKEWYEAKSAGNEYKKVPAHSRSELIPNYLKDTRAVLFIDDAHKLSGRKLMIAKQCIQSGYRVVIACSDENKLAPSIRRLFLETKPQILRLNTDVAYDATHALIWAFVFFFVVTGMTELAMILGFLETMKGGRRGSKQD